MIDKSPNENQAPDNNQALDAIKDESPELAELITKDPKIEQVFRESPQLQQAILSISHRSFSGPMPPPELLREYESIIPGIAKEMFDMVKDDASHIRNMQEKALQAKKDEIRIGQIFGFLIGIAALVAGTITSVMGAPLAGGFIGGSGVIGLVTVFVTSAKHKNSQ